jgi:hypothetical protein
MVTDYRRHGNSDVENAVRLKRFKEIVQWAIGCGKNYFGHLWIVSDAIKPDGVTRHNNSGHRQEMPGSCQK